MSKTIKVIDLLNRRANGDEMPKEIKTNSNSYVFDENATCIENIYQTNNHMKTGWFNKEDFLLNDTVEIIEEQPEIDIQRIEELSKISGFNTTDTIGNHFNKINELIRAVKQLDKRKEK